MKKRKKGYFILLSITILLTLAAISTLIPVSVASKNNYIGYMSHCTFTPWSTLLCALLTGITCTIRKKKFTE